MGGTLQWPRGLAGFLFWRFRAPAVRRDVAFAMVGALPFAGGHRDDCPVVGANGIASKPLVAWAPLEEKN